MLILVVLLAAACGSRAKHFDNQAAANAPAKPQPTVQSGDDQPRSRLISGLPSLSGKPAGTEFEFTLRASLTEPAFQGSARVLYDSSLVEPVNAVQGKDLPSGEVVLARTDARPGTLELSSLDRPAGLDGCVPFAFTARPGGASIPPGGAELLRVKFRLLRANPDGIPVRVQNDPQFLQLRDSKGRRIAFDLEREAGAR